VYKIGKLVTFGEEHIILAMNGIAWVS